MQTDVPTPSVPLVSPSSALRPPPADLQSPICNLQSSSDDARSKVGVPLTTPASGSGTGKPERAPCALARSGASEAPDLQSPISDLPLPSSFAIPEQDTLEFTRLPQQVRDDIRRQLHSFRFIHSATNVITACKVQAMNFQGRRGFSWQRLRSKYYDYISAWDWHVLIDRAKAGPTYWAGEHKTLPRATAEYWRAQCEGNQRSCAAAWRKLIRQWQAWRAGDRSAAIPGYDQCPEPDPATGRPPGWDLSNFMRYKPSKFELVAARQGRSAAAAFRPLVLMTRVGLSVGQYYLFDDMWHDFKVTVIGQRHAQRLLQFHALDLFSGCNFARGYKPVIENEMTGVMERLKESEMVFLVAHVLAHDGYRREGTILVSERGTATIRPDVESKIFELTDGCVRVELSTMDNGGAAIAGAYGGRPKGNFRCKAALESLGGLIHNETADIRLIPGQTGSNQRVNGPEEMHGREANQDALLCALVALAETEPELVASLRLPFVEVNRAIWLMDEIHNRINARTDHDLEGWVKAHLVANEFRLGVDQPWTPLGKLLSMPQPQRQAVEAYLDAAAIQGSCLTRVRKLSPKEVWDDGRRQLIKLPPHKTAMLLYECVKDGKASVEVSVRKQLLEFSNQTLASEPLHFVAEASLPGRPDSLLPDGEKYDVVVNPLDLTVAHLFDASGRYVGACPSWDKVSRADVDALRRAAGEAKRLEAAVLKGPRQRGADITRQRIADMRHNAAVLRGPRESKPPVSTQGVTPEDFEQLAAIDLPQHTNSSAAGQEAALAELE